MIHKYKLGGYNIVLDVASGALHVVDDVAFDIIDLFETEDKSSVISKMKDKYLGKDEITEEDIEECALTGIGCAGDCDWNSVLDCVAELE